MTMPREMSDDQRERSRQAAIVARGGIEERVGLGWAEDEAVAVRLRVGVEDRVGQSAGPPHDGDRAVSQGDHLALAAGLEARGHQERVRPGVDAPCLVAIEAIEDDDAIRHPRRERSEVGHELVGAGAEDDQPPAGRDQPLRRLRDEVETLLRVEPPDHAEDRAVGMEAVAGGQVRPADSFAGQLVAREGGRQGGVGGWIPELGVDAVDDARVAVAEPAQQVVDPRAHLRLERLAGEAGADGVDEVGGADGGAQEVDALAATAGGADAAGRKVAQLPDAFGRRPAVVREVVTGQDSRGCRQLRRHAAGLTRPQRQERRAGLPVVAVEDVHRLPIELDAGQGGSGQEREPGGVVRVVGAAVHVVVGAVEAVGMVDQSESVAIRLTIDEVDGCHVTDIAALARPRADRDADGPTRQGARRGLQPTVEGQHHGHLVAALAERPGQRVDDVRQAARLGEGFALGGDHDDAHRRIVAATRGQGCRLGTEPGERIDW